MIVVAASGIIGGAFIWIGAGHPALGRGLRPRSSEPALRRAGVAVRARASERSSSGSGHGSTSPVTYGLLGWSLLVELVGGIGALSHWVLDTSIFHQMASAPAVPVNWEANAVMAGIGILSAGVGSIGFRRRDLAGQ